MPFWRILLTAFGAQIVLVGAGGPLIGLAGGLDHVGKMSGGVKLFELLAEQLRSASRSVSNTDIKPGFRLKK